MEKFTKRLSVIIEKIRKWLENNQIFFIVIPSLLLSYMAVTVSMKSNELVKDQNRLISLEYLPKFSFIPSLMRNKDEFSSITSTSGIEIVNNEGIFYDRFSFVEISLLALTITDDEKIKKMTIPIEYFDPSFDNPVKSKDGLIAIIAGIYGNDTKYLALRDLVKNVDGFEIRLNHYISLSYRETLNNEEKLESFVIDDYDGGSIEEITNAEFANILFNRLEKPLNISSDFDTIKATINGYIQEKK